MRAAKTGKLKKGYTNRESEIVKKLLMGTSYKNIATELSIGIETVRTHVKHIYRKSKVQSRAELAWKLLAVK